MTRYTFAWVLRSLLAIAILTFANGRLLHAQVDTGSILGTVTDQSGAVISGVKVTLTNQETGMSLTTTTGSDGSYKFSPVRIGSYKIEVVFQGFRTNTAAGIKVDIESSVIQNFKLQPGAVSETVEVTAATPLLQSQDSSVGQVVDRRTINDLPLNGRNFTFLAQLGAGVNTPQADTRGNASSGAFAANGQQPSLNNYLLDGIDNNSDTVDFLNGTNFVVLPPVDAIQEFKVQTTDFSAQYGRSGAAILNATTRSGTNQLHGSIWEFFRNDKFDAANFFEDQEGIPKGALRQNQFGFTVGGPVVIPHIFNGRNKVFFYGDYEGLRRVQGTSSNGNVPTLAERNSGYTNFSDLIAAQSGTQTDALGRTIPVGTILDPATTRPVTAGDVDPVTGLPVTTTGYVRDPFYTGSLVGITNFTNLESKLNQIPAGRLDSNAIKLMNLFPLPTSSSLPSFFSNFESSPKLFEHSNAFDSRLDINFNDANSVFFRFSLKDDPQFIPGVFGGLADGGAFQQGTQTALAQQSALVYTHTFSPTLVNEVHAGLNYLHTTRAGPNAGVDGIPAQFGIQDIPQGQLNGGLPAFGINGLSTLGSNNFLPSDEVSSTIQLTDDVTKIYRKHTFKMGLEWQHVKFSTLQPSWSHGQFNFDGNFTDVAGGADTSNTGRADFLLTPIASSVPGGVNYLGGPDNIYASNIATTDDGKNYFGGYFQDDWKVSAKLTLNLGLRYDYFGQVFEHHHAQANFVPDGPGGVPTEIIPLGNPNVADLSASYTSLLAKDGITLLQTNKYGGGLGTVQKGNFAPRVGFAYQVTPKLVARGGFGMFYNAFENRGYSPNLGESYPFQYSFNYIAPNTSTPFTFPGCAATGNPNFTATLETGFGCTPLNPANVNASGLALPGIQFNYQTPYSMGANLTFQYQISPSLALQAGWVTDQGRHIETLPNSNNVSTISYYQAPKVSLVPFPDFGTGASFVATNGNSNYNGLQTQLEKRLTNGLDFLFTYTWSKALTDARDALNQGSVLTSYRAPSVPGFGIHGDYALAPEDIRNVFHFSGGYELPFGKGKRFANSGFENQVIGGWSLHWQSTFEGGQPISLVSTTAGNGCVELTAAGLGCGALKIPGQQVHVGLHTDSNGKLSLFSNGLAALTQPCVIGPTGQPIPGTPTGCVPLTGLAALGGTPEYEGPSFNRLDLSVFKNIPISERFRLEFRAEFFNIANHPNFNAPGFGGNGVLSIPGSLNYSQPSATSTFGEIGSTRDGSYDSREIQFALKLYY